MSVLYETSNELSNKFNGTEIINTTTESLAKVFDFEVSAVLYFSNSPEIHIHSKNNISKQHLISIKEGMLLAIKPFNDANFDSNKIKTKLNIANNEKINSDSKINTFAMIPLIFKNETIGMLTIYKVNATKPAINEMKFLQTLTNLLSTNLGKLDTLKKVETTKINSLVRSIDDGLILIDGENNITYTNPATKRILSPNKKVFSKSLLNSILNELNIYNAIDIFKKSRKSTYQLEIKHDNKFISIIINNVVGLTNKKSATAITLRDISEKRKADRINKQRLNAILNVDQIINNITDLDKLLIVLMEYFLNLANTEIGSIQLIEGKNIITKVHSNFPDKIRRQYKFKSGETITEHTLRTAKPFYILNYETSETLSQTTKVPISFYLCLPFIVKNSIIGILNIAKKRLTRQKRSKLKIL